MFQHLLLAALAATLCNGQVLESAKNPICTQGRGYYAVEGSCDSYIECKDNIARKMLCPDGLHFNPATIWPNYPCGYPTDISCEGRGAVQKAIVSEGCPHLYGFFPSTKATANECGHYQMCVEGKSIEMVCPPGLAFNPEKAQCDWPHLVSSCNADDFLRFKCPALPLGNYKLEGNCFAFFSCEYGHARLLTCDPGYAFDPNTGHCEDAEKVDCRI